MVLDVVHDDERAQANRIVGCSPVIVDVRDRDSGVGGNISHCGDLIANFLVRKRNGAYSSHYPRTIIRIAHGVPLIGTLITADEPSLYSRR